MPGPCLALVGVNLYLPARESNTRFSGGRDAPRRVFTLWLMYHSSLRCTHPHFGGIAGKSTVETTTRYNFPKWPAHRARTSELSFIVMSSGAFSEEQRGGTSSDRIPLYAGYESVDLLLSTISKTPETCGSVSVPTAPHRLTLQIPVIISSPAFLSASIVF